MYKTLVPRDASRLVGGGQIVTVASVSKEGVPDCMTAAWNTAYDSDQVLVVLDLGHTTTRNILDTGKFVVGIPDESLVKEILKVGSEHGRVTGDKFKWVGIAPEKSAKLGIDVIPGQMAYIECELGDKDVFEKTGVAIGKAVNITVKEELWDDESSSFGKGYQHNLHYVSGEVFCTGGTLIKV